MPKRDDEAPPDWEQSEMFPVPKVYRAPERKAEPNVIRWTKHSGKRLSCDLCILNIHNGVRETGLHHATKVATVNDRKWHLCSQHANQVRQGERKLS